MSKAVLALTFAISMLLAFSQANAQPDDDPKDPPTGGDGDGDGDGDKVGDGDGDGDKAGDGDGDGTDKPAATEPPKTDEPADVDALRRRYLDLRDKLFRSRARAATVASALYSTRVEIKLRHKSGRHYSINRATIRLDGANVYDDADGKISDDAAVRFEGYIAPGRHRLTVRIEATGKDDDRFTTASETTMVVVAVEGEDLLIDARAEDDGDIAYNWQRKEKGTYRLRLDVDVKSVERKGSKGKKKSKKKKATKAKAKATKRRQQRASR